MIKTSADNPILLLHSSCTGDDAAIASSAWEYTTNDRTRYNIYGAELSKQPIFCDLLLLPEHHGAETTSSEHPSNHASSTTSPQHDYLHLPNNPMNPCGVSNVLALENLPERWIAGSVLLSLTSCSIFHRNGDDNDDEFTTSIPLHVEPIPSTFVLDFHSNQGLGGNDDGGVITTVKTMSEIFVEFDVREASRQAKEILLRQENHTRTDTGEDQEESRPENHLKNHPDHHHRYKVRSDHRYKVRSDNSETSVLQDDGIEAKGEEEDSFYHDRRPRLEDLSRSLNLNGLFANKDFKEQKLLLSQLNAQLDQGTRTMDLVLFICGFFSIFLTAILLWTIYQYYRTTFKSDLFTEEIRESMKTTNDILQMAVNELNQYDHHNLNQHHFLNVLHMNKSECETETTVAIKLDMKTLGTGDRTDNKSRGNFTTSSRMDHSKPDSLNALCQDTSSTNNKNNEKENTFAPIPYGVSTDIHRQGISNGQDKDGEVENKNNLVRPSQDNAARRFTRNQDVDISLVVQGKEQLEGEKSNLITPTRDNNSVDTRNQDVSSEDKVEGQALDGIITCSPDQLPEVPTSPQKEGENKLFFVRSSSSRHGKSFRTSHVNKTTKYNSSPLNLVKEWSDEKIIYPRKKKTMETPLSPCSQLAKEWNGGETSAQSEEMIPSTPLSPCSQLAKEWNEGKTIRRGNLKKRRHYLKPPLQSNTEPISSSSKTKCNDDGGKTLFESTILSRVPKTSKLHSRYYQQQTLAGTISGPPKLRSIARNNNLVDETTIQSLLADQVVKGCKEGNVDEERKTMDGMKTPPSNMITLKTPRLCYTPASEDDSFVDDYW
jgi:hypothetical protein